MLGRMATLQLARRWIAPSPQASLPKLFAPVSAAGAVGADGVDYMNPPATSPAPPAMTLSNEAPAAPTVGARVAGLPTWVKLLGGGVLLLGAGAAVYKLTE